MPHQLYALEISFQSLLIFFFFVIIFLLFQGLTTHMKFFTWKREHRIFNIKEFFSPMELNLFYGVPINWHTGKIERESISRAFIFIQLEKNIKYVNFWIAEKSFAVKVSPLLQSTITTPEKQTPAQNVTHFIKLSKTIQPCIPWDWK